jgi:hypothetical protein
VLRVVSWRRSAGAADPLDVGGGDIEGSGGLTKRRAFLAIVVVLCGAALGWFVGRLSDPSHAEIRAAAEALVPDGATVTERAENTGHPLIVGEYFVFISFQLPRAEPGGVEAALAERSRSLGYATWRAEALPGGTARHAVHAPMKARLGAFRTLSREGYGEGTIRVEADPESKRNRRIVGAASGSIALPALTLLLIGWWTRFRRRSGRPSRVPPDG